MLKVILFPLFLVIVSSRVVWPMDPIEKLFYVDQALLNHGTPGDRVAAEVLRSVYSKQPDFDPQIAVDVGVRIRKAWDERYADSDSVGGRAELEDEMQLLAEGIVGSAVSGSLADLAVNAFKVAWGQSARQLRDAERDIALMFAGQNAVGLKHLVGVAGSGLQQQHSLYQLLEEAADNPKLSSAASALLKESLKGAQLEDEAEEWERRHPGTATQLRTQRIEALLKALKEQRERGSLSEADKEALGGLMKTVLEETNRDRPGGQRVMERTRSEKSPEQRSAEIDQHFLPLLAVTSIVKDIAKNNSEVTAVATVAQGSLQIGRLMAQYASGLLPLSGALLSGHGVVTSLVGQLQLSTGLKQSDTQLILRAIALIRKEMELLREELRDFRTEMLAEFRQVYISLSSRIDHIERSLRGEVREVKDLLLAHARATGATQEQIERIERVLLSLHVQQRVQHLRPVLMRTEWDEPMEYDLFRVTMDQLASCAVGDASDPMMVGVAPKPHTSDLTPKSLHAFLQPMATGEDYWDRTGVTFPLLRLMMGAKLEQLKPVNLKLWSLCASGFFRLASRWPDHYSKYDKRLEQLSAILEKGHHIRGSVQGVVMAFEDQHKPLLDEFISLYSSVFLNVRREVEKVTDSLKAKHALGPVHLFGEQDEEAIRATFTVNSLFEHRTQIKSCPGFAVSPQLNRPFLVPFDQSTAIQVGKEQTKTVSEWVPAEYIALEKMGKGRVYICYSGFGFEDTVTNRDPNVPDQVRQDFPGTMRFTIQWSYHRVYTDFLVYYWHENRSDKAILVSKIRTKTRTHLEGSGTTDTTNPALVRAMLRIKEVPNPSKQEDRWTHERAIQELFLQTENTVDTEHNKEARLLFSEAIRFIRDEAVRALRAALSAKVGALHEGLGTLDTLNVALQDYVRISLGSVAETDQGKGLLEDALELPGSGAVVNAMEENFSVYMDPALQTDAFSLLRHPYKSFQERFQKHVREDGPLLGRHALLENVQAQLELMGTTRSVSSQK